MTGIPEASSGKRPAGHRIVVLSLSVLLVLATVVVAAPKKAHGAINTGVSADDLADAVVVQGGGGFLVDAVFVSKPPDGAPVAVADTALAGFPTKGPDYAILTTGSAALADDPNDSESSGVDIGGGNVRGDSDFDVTVFRIDLSIPAAKNCLSFDFRFLSDEFPEFVGSSFNDAFIAELDASTWTTTGSTVSAPDNFAFDELGNVISINAAGAASMSAPEAAGTTYDGATPLLRAKTPLTPGAHSVYFSIFDQGDHSLDSAVFVDNLFAGVVDDVSQCQEGALPVVTVPDPPTGLVADPGPGAGDLTVGWQAPVSDGGAVVTAYRVYRGTTSGAEAFLVEVGTDLAHLDAGLPNGATLFYYVTAVNSVGESAPSNEDSAATFDVPGVPQGVGAVAGPEASAIRVSWSAPLTDGGTPIAGYEVHAGAASGSLALLAELGPDVVSYDDSGPGPGATRFYQVRATNLVGAGPPSSEVSASAFDVPSAPVGLVATPGPGAGQIALAWEAPASDGGTPVTNYRLYRGDAGGGQSFLIEVGDVLTFLDTSLGNGATQFYRVGAVNAAGKGPLSNEDSATTFDVPSAPASLAADPGPGAAQLTLTWQAPATDGGSPLTGYEVHRGETSGSATLLATLGDVLTFTDSGLGNGVTHFYQVRALNLAGPGAFSNEDSDATFDVPGAPQNLDASRGPGLGEISLAWEAPAADGGTPVTGYEVHRGTAPDGLTLAATLSAELSYLDSGLAAGTLYHYEVRALNLAGAGPASGPDSDSTFGAPTPPQNLVASSGPDFQQIGLAWEAPAGDGGKPVTGYTVYRGDASGTETFLADVDAATTSYLDAPLPHATTFYYVVTASNIVGEGDVSNEAFAATLTAPPPPLPSGRKDTAAAWTGDAAYVFGGTGTSGAEGGSPDGPSQAGAEFYLDEILRYDPATNEVDDTGVPLPTDRCCMEAAYTGDTIFLFGGQDAGGFLGDILAFNPDTNELSGIDADLPTDRCCMASAWDGSNVWLFGGQDETGYLDDVIRFDPVTEEVDLIDVPLISDRCCMAAGWDGDNIYLFGGKDADGFLGDILIFNPATQTFTASAASLPTDRCCLEATFDGDGFLLMGGQDANGDLSDVLRYSPATDSLEDVGDLPSDRCCMSAVWDGDNVVLFGGSSGETFLDDILPYAANAPQNLGAQAGPGAGEVTLGWDAPVGLPKPVAGYRIWRATESGGETFLAQIADGTTFVDRGLDEDTTYFYKVSAVTDTDETLQSNEASATTFARPAEPTGLTASNGPKGGQITLEWTAPMDDGGTSVTNYVVYRGFDPDDLGVLLEVGDETRYTDASCPMGDECFYRVSARNAVGEGPASGVASAIALPIVCHADVTPTPSGVKVDAGCDAKV